MAEDNLGYSLPDIEASLMSTEMIKRHMYDFAGRKKYEFRRRCQDEPMAHTVQMLEERLRTDFDRYLGKIEVAIYATLALLLTITVVAGIASACKLLWDAVGSWSIASQTLRVLNELLIVLMLVEILHTVRISIRSALAHPRLQNSLVRLLALLGDRPAQGRQRREVVQRVGQVRIAPRRLWRIPDCKILLCGSWPSQRIDLREADRSAEKLSSGWASADRSDAFSAFDFGKNLKKIVDRSNRASPLFSSKQYLAKEKRKLVITDDYALDTSPLF